MKKQLLLLLAVFLALASPAFAQYAIPFGYTGTTQSATDFTAATTVAHSHATGVTLTLTPGAGNYIYVTGLDISDCQGTAVTAAAPTYITTTGFAGILPQYQVGSGPATAGVCSPTVSLTFARPIKSATAGTAVTYVMPTFITNQVVSLNVYYYIAP